MNEASHRPPPPRPRRLSDAELKEVAGIGGVGLTGYGILAGELVADPGAKIRLITSGKGTRSEVSFTIDAPVTRLDLLPGHLLRVFGLIHKTTQWVGTIRRAQVLHDHLDPALLPGMHVELAGVVDNREPVAIGGEAMPSGSYLRLERPIHLSGAVFEELVLEHSPFPQGHALKAYGRLELRSVGGVETPLRHFAALSGVSDVGAGEPRFDGVQFHSAINGAHLRVLTIRRQDLFDAPNAIVVLDGPAARAFLGSMGGLMMPGRNPFHGFGASAEISAPSDAERASVRFDEAGNATDAATGQPLLLLDREQPPPNVVDGLTTTWYFDPAQEIVYAFISGGIAGFNNRMSAVMRFPHDDPGE
ncbi:MAG: hypothetical protein IPO88_30380 [Nannocystis sp.]|uniref:hypothetical protein n=1 Tax=Nannocystis sp. TaxID=1962667 RepID=UPI002422F012|nr:hypothetical protein [Nannocystis sp.]MBK9757740.1 hypothetical protein [Nannocystis sp.]